MRVSIRKRLPKTAIKLEYAASIDQIDEMRRALRREFGKQYTSPERILWEYLYRNMSMENFVYLKVPKK